MTTATLELKQISKSYGALRATHKVSLSVKKGEIHALIGPNGAGKTTLIKQIYGSEKPDSGQIFLDGEPINHTPTSFRVRRGIGRSFQISNVLLEFTVLQNALIAELARQGETFQFFAPAFSDPSLLSGAFDILKRVGLLHQSEKLAAEISHGERRLLELALAMGTNPTLLLLDEPMAGAGIEESRHITSIIKAEKGNHATLLIEHDMDAVFQLADRITVLVEGEAIASGTPDEISNNTVLRNAYLGDGEVYADSG